MRCGWTEVWKCEKGLAISRDDGARVNEQCAVQVYALRCADKVGYAVGQGYFQVAVTVVAAREVGAVAVVVYDEDVCGCASLGVEKDVV